MIILLYYDDKVCSFFIAMIPFVSLHYCNDKSSPGIITMINHGIALSLHHSCDKICHLLHYYDGICLLLIMIKPVGICPITAMTKWCQFLGCFSFCLFFVVCVCMRVCVCVCVQHFCVF